MTRIRTRARSLVLATVAAILLTACGGAGGEQAGGSGDALAVTGTDDLQWDVEKLSAPAGTIEFALTCEDAVNHNLVIEETGEMVAECAPGETATGSVELEAGTYTYVCTVPGHGSTMVGELTVS